MGNKIKLYKNTSILNSFTLLTCLVLVLSRNPCRAVYDIYVYNEEITNNVNENAQYTFDKHQVAENKPHDAQCSTVPVANRFDCHPGPFANEEKCLERGCCWASPPSTFDTTSKSNMNIPWCFYPNDYRSHSVINITHTESGVSVWYERLIDSGYPDDSNYVRLDIGCYDNKRLNIKIWDDSKQIHLKDNEILTPLETCGVSLKVSNSQFGFQLSRKDTDTILFDCLDIGGFVYSNQLLQISSLLPSNYIYGLGEHTGRFLRNTDWSQYTFWNRDFIPTENMNIYGTHPFYLSLDNIGSSHGVYFKNTHAMEVILQPSPAVTFRALGGIIHIYIMLGTAPLEVVEQYSNIIGKPFLPPYWTLGYHQCRFGYKTLERTKEILDQTRKANIPIDVQWNDIDYMDQFKDFTYDHKNYNGLPKFVQELHKEGLKYIQIIDPGISGSEIPGTYPPYDKGIEMDIFVKNTSNLPFVGKVWNTQSTVWPDFTDPKTLEYWTLMLKNYHSEIPIDGVWIDMNEPSNFFDGQIDGCAKEGDDLKLDEPYYIPKGITGNKLYAKTVCPSARHYNGFHYEFHNTYGLDETIATATAMKKIRKKRAFVVSRSTFPGQGHHGAHWTGDVVSTWKDMRASIASIINLNMFGIPMVGADICGFNGNTTIELCNRWVQLGAFYPFSRNHNTDDGIDQDPVSLGEPVIESARNALRVRYKLLPVLYNLLVNSHLFGTPVARAMMFNYPNDRKTYALDAQFMWGSDLLILPVLEEETYGSVTGYFPKDTWYDFYGKNDPFYGTAHFKAVDAPETVIPLFVRGGSILPFQNNGSTTVETRQNPFHLKVYFPINTECSTCDLEAKGELYLDDGEDIDSYATNRFTHVKFSGKESDTTKDGNLRSVVRVRGGINLNQNTILEDIHIFGIKNVTSIKTVTINGKTISFSNENTYLTISGVNHDLMEEFVLAWSKNDL